MRKIIHFLHIDSTPGKVDWALTTKQGLTGWWTTHAQVPQGVKQILDFRFEEDFNPFMEVTDHEPGRRIEWICVDGHEPWRNDRFTFDLRESGGGTDLLFIQACHQEAPDEVFGRYNFSWGYYLHSLKQLCETGTGTPFRAH